MRSIAGARGFVLPKPLLIGIAAVLISLAANPLGCAAVETQLRLAGSELQALVTREWRELAGMAETSSSRLIAEASDPVARDKGAWPEGGALACAAAVRQVYVEETLYREVSLPVIYIIRTVAGRPRGQARLPDAWQAEIVNSLTDLPQVVWIDSETQVVSAERGVVREGGGVITLSDLHYQEENGWVTVSASLYYL